MSKIDQRRHATLFAPFWTGLSGLLCIVTTVGDEPRKHACSSTLGSCRSCKSEPGFPVRSKRYCRRFRLLIHSFAHPENTCRRDPGSIGMDAESHRRCRTSSIFEGALNSVPVRSRKRFVRSNLICEDTMFIAAECHETRPSIQPHREAFRLFRSMTRSRRSLARCGSSHRAVRTRVGFEAPRRCKSKLASFWNRTAEVAKSLKRDCRADRRSAIEATNPCPPFNLVMWDHPCQDFVAFFSNDIVATFFLSFRNPFDSHHVCEPRR